MSMLTKLEDVCGGIGRSDFSPVVVTAASRTTISGDGSAAFEPTTIGREPRDERRVRQAWRTIIDEKLLEWARNPAVFSNLEFEPFDQNVVDCANLFAQTCGRDLVDPPEDVVPTQGGAIEMTWRYPAGEISLEFTPEGKAELTLVRDDEVVDFRTITLPTIR